MSNIFKGKKLLILGGKPIGSCEIVEYAKKQGIYTIVADYLSNDESPAKKIADEAWNISTADVGALSQKIKENQIDGVYAGVHEFNIEKAIQLCEMNNLPCFCTLEQWQTLNNKRKFKDLCKQFDVPVTKEYNITTLSEAERIPNSEYPLIVKPVDGSGSRGFSVCYDKEQLLNGIEKAKEFSDTEGVLIEQYMNYKNSAIINYTIIDGEVYFSGISDKKSKKVFDDGAPVMAVQYYPSKYQDEYLKKIDLNVKKMFKEFGLKNGVVWIEAFCQDGSFVFNEMGYRFGGSLTYFPVMHLYGMDQLKLQIEYALLGKNQKQELDNPNIDGCYVILPIHVRPGIIKRIVGFDKLEKRPETKKIVYVHYEGDCIQNWGSAQQVFAYLHFHCSNKNEAKKLLNNVLEDIFVYDENNQNMLFYLYEEKL